MNTKAIIFFTCLVLHLYDVNAGLCDRIKPTTTTSAPAATITAASTSASAPAPGQPSTPVPAPAASTPPKAPASEQPPAPEKSAVPAQTKAAVPAAVTPPAPVPEPAPYKDQPPKLEVGPAIIITPNQCKNVAYDALLKYTDVGSNAEDMTIINTGTLVEMTLNRKSSNPSISFGPLIPRQDYLFDRLVIQWGRSETSGSDITVNDVRAGLHFKFNYASKAGNKAVVSYLINSKVVNQDTTLFKDDEFATFSGNITLIRNPNLPITFLYKFTSLIPNVLDHKYFAFRDNKNVIQIVYQDRKDLPRTQISVFRSLVGLDGKTLSNGNCDTPQKIDNSKVYFVN